MARSKGTELSVFKGREAKLNRAIFQTLALEGPQTIYDLAKKIKKQKFMHRKLYSVINRRVRALEQTGYIEKAGSRKTLAGFSATAYQINVRAYLALFFDCLNPMGIIEKMNETTVLNFLASVVLVEDVA